MRHPRLAPTVAAMFAPLALSATAHAAEPAALPAGGAAGMIMNLALVLLLIVVCGWFYARGPARLRGTTGALDIVASRQVGNRERLAVVQVGDEQVLLGITANGISHLHTLSEPIKADAPAAANTAFASKLRELGAALKRGEPTS